MTDELPEFAVRIPAGGDSRHAEITLDGRRIERQLRGVQINLSATDADPRVMLELAPRGDLTDLFVGLAHVSIVDVESDPGPAAATFLSAIDPGELQRAALSRPHLGSGPEDLTRAMLDTLIGWARGGA